MTLTLEDNTTAELPAGVIGRVRGTAGTADTINRNKRRYPAADYRQAVRQFNARPATDPMLGELDHHYGASLAHSALHIQEVSMRNDTLTFRAHLLDTAAGRDLKGILDAGVAVNVSTRGTGTMTYCCTDHQDADHDEYMTGKRPAVKSDHEPHMVVSSDYELHGIDAVSRGGHARAAMHNEGAHAQEGDPMDSTNPNLTEGAEAETQNRLAALEAENARLKADLTVLQTATRAESEAAASTVAAAQATINTLRAERDTAAAQLNRQAVEAEIQTALASLRPDVQAKIAEQLKSCATPEDVKARWDGLRSVLETAGLTTPPAGSGKSSPDPDATPTHGAVDTTKLTPDQMLQRQLLGF